VSDLDRLRGANRRDLTWLVGKYMQSRKFTDLSKHSQRDGEVLKRVLEHPLAIAGEQTTLGSITPAQVTKPLVRRVRERRLEQYQAAGRKGTVMVNREVAFLSTAMSWASENLDGIPAENPFKISKLKEQSRSHLVTDDDYTLQSGLAAEIAGYLPVVFELTYLLASRGVETLDISMADISDEGIKVHRRKGSRDNLIEWSARLRAAYDAALAWRSQFKITQINAPLLLNAKGEALTKHGLDSAMGRLRNKMAERGLQDRYWSMHMLKHKGVSDSTDKTIAGHVSESIRNIYDHSLPRNKPAR